MEVSVVISFFNARETLLRAFDSVLKQDLIREIILIDDGSDDGSDLIAKQISQTNFQVIFVENVDRVNRGACAARNLGLSLAKSDWIQFLDADDELLEGKIEKQLEKTNNKMSFVVGNAIDCFEDGHIHFRRFLNDPWAGLIAGKLGITSANLWNRNRLLEVGGWRESLSSSQEYDLMFRLLKENGSVGFSREFLTKIHKRPNSISQSTFGKCQRIENWLKLRVEINGFLRSKGLFNFSRNYIYSGYLLDYCTRNDCIQEFDGSRVLGELFRIEKQIKTKVFQIIKAR